ncbi:MAG: O-antigen polymerase family protein [Micavibrio sp.]|nr:O-antigen polymerase family protein [Micavibrio sp.]
MKITTIARLSGLFWALAFFLSLGTIPPLEIERLEAMVFGLFSLLPLILCGRPLGARVMAAPRVGGLMLGLWLLATVSCAWSVAPPISLIYLGIFCCLPATVLAVLIADPAVRQGFLQSALVCAGIVVLGLAVWALVQIFFMPEHLVYGQVRDPFSNPNIFAALLSLGFFTALAMALQADGKGSARLLMAAAFIILCAFVAMAGKAASMLLFAGVAIWLAVSWRAIFPAHWKSLASMAAGLIMVEGLIANLPGRASLLSSMGGLVEGNVTSSLARLDLWRATWAMIAKHPWTGAGYRSFFLVYPSERLPGEIYSGGFMAHNDPLQLWAEIGVMGPILFYAIGLGVFYRFIRFWREGAAAGTMKASVLALFLGCSAFVAHSHVDFPFYAMPTMMVFGLVLAWLLAKTDIEAKATPLDFMAGWPRALQGVAVAGPVMAIVMVFTPIMLGEYQTGRAEQAMQRGDMQGFGRAVNAANKIGWGMNDRPYLQATRVPMGILETRGARLGQEEQMKLFQQVDSLLNRAQDRNAMMAGVWYQRGLLVRAVSPAVVPSGYPEEAACFARAMAINPLYLPARLALADIYEKRGDKKKTLEVLAAGVAWPYTSYDSYAYLDRTETLAKALHRDDLLPVIAQARERQKSRLPVGE